MEKIKLLSKAGRNIVIYPTDFWKTNIPQYTKHYISYNAKGRLKECFNLLMKEQKIKYFYNYNYIFVDNVISIYIYKVKVEKKENGEYIVKSYYFSGKNNEESIQLWELFFEENTYSYPYILCYTEQEAINQIKHNYT